MIDPCIDNGLDLCVGGVKVLEEEENELEVAGLLTIAIGVDDDDEEEEDDDVFVLT